MIAAYSAAKAQSFLAINEKYTAHAYLTFLMFALHLFNSLHLHMHLLLHLHRTSEPGLNVQFDHTGFKVSSITIATKFKNRSHLLLNWSHPQGYTIKHLLCRHVEPLLLDISLWVFLHPISRDQLLDCTRN